jgi:hypothetical protein
MLLPHGVEDVRKHLKEADNVPFLSAYSMDVNQVRQTRMYVFRSPNFASTPKLTLALLGRDLQEYSDTVIKSTFTPLWNEGIFSTADISVGIDVPPKLLKGVPILLSFSECA